MKFHWGHGIFLFILLFLAAMTWVIVFSFSQKVNLVTPEYYPKGVNYEEQINKVKNTAALKQKIELEKENRKLILRFPDKFKGQVVTGTIQFYYVTDYEKDRKMDIDLDSTGSQLIDISSFISGRYLIKIDWSANKQGYYQEFDINL